MMPGYTDPEKVRHTLAVIFATIGAAIVALLWLFAALTERDGGERQMPVRVYGAPK